MFESSYEIEPTLGLVTAQAHFAAKEREPEPPRSATSLSLIPPCLLACLLVPPPASVHVGDELELHLALTVNFPASGESGRHESHDLGAKHET